MLVGQVAQGGDPERPGAPRQPAPGARKAVAAAGERRQQLLGQVRKLGEAQKVAIRNVRQRSNDTLKKMLKDKEIAEDDERGCLDDVQKLTNTYIAKIDEMGGMIAAIDKGYPQMEIADAAYHFQQQLESGEKAMVGINRYATGEAQEIPYLEIDEAVAYAEAGTLEPVEDLTRFVYSEGSTAAPARQGVR